jgi:hypothetical protein
MFGSSAIAKGILCIGMALCVSYCEAAVPFGDLAQSHIEANVPKKSDFDRFFRRDLTSYFAQTFGAAIRVEYELLRRGPTQSGTSYPKYYAWVRIVSPGGATREGAVRVAAIEETHFEVTDFLTSDQIRTNSGSVATIFPAPLVSDMLQRAARSPVR